MSSVKQYGFRMPKYKYDLLSEMSTNAKVSIACLLNIGADYVLGSSRKKDYYMNKTNLIDNLLMYKSFLEDPDTGKELTTEDVDTILEELGAYHG